MPIIVNEKLVDITCFTCGESPRNPNEIGTFYGIQPIENGRSYDIYEETIGTLRNIHAGLISQGMGLNNVSQLNVFLSDPEKNKTELFRALMQIFSNKETNPYLGSVILNKQVRLRLFEAIGFPNQTDLQITAIANKANTNTHVPLKMFDPNHKLPPPVSSYSHVRKIPENTRISTITLYPELSNGVPIFKTFREQAYSVFQQLERHTQELNSKSKDVLFVLAKLVNGNREDNNVKMDSDFFSEYNGIWSEYFSLKTLQDSLPPARASVEVKKDSILEEVYIELDTVIVDNHMRI